MRERTATSKMNKIICCMIATIFAIAGLVIPVYGDTGAEEAANDSQMQTYEKSADSWRFQDGYLVTEERPAMFRARASFVPWSKTEDGYVSSDGSIIKGAVRKGIDVSTHQGKIDWAKVKADGIDFAIIRCGYGDDEKDQDDAYWMRNVSECERLGIPYGVYIYSYANSEYHIKSEIAHTLRLLKEAKADPDYPIYLDLEDKEVQRAGSANIVKYAKMFCSTIEAEGYEAGIYANLNWWRNILYSIPGNPQFEDYDIWVAQYYSECTYELGEYRLWQCASDGVVNGISGRVDLNFEFILKHETNRAPRVIADENGIEYFINPRGDKILSQWVVYDDKNFYADAEGKKVSGLQEIEGKTYYIDSAAGKQINKWVDVDGNKYYLDKNGAALTGYNPVGDNYYLFDNKGVMQTNDTVYEGKEYKLFSTGIACLHSAQVKSNVNYRTGPSTSYAIKGSYTKGKVVYVVGVKGQWSRLSTGYWVESKYLTKQTVYPKTSVIDNSYDVVAIDHTCFRAGPDSKYAKKGMYKRGQVLTIIDESNGWGKTSRGYWINLLNVEKIK